MQVWLGLLVVILLVIVFVLAGALLAVTIGPLGGGRPGSDSLDALESQARTAQDPALFVDLGYEYRKQGRREDALEAFRRALELDPKNTAALYHEGAVLLEAGDSISAEQVFWDVLEIDSTHAMAAKALGELYASRGHYRSLLVAVRPAAEANPALADLQYLLGLGFEKTGDLRGAARAYWNARQRDPDLKEAREGLERVGGEKE